MKRGNTILCISAIILISFIILGVSGCNAPGNDSNTGSDVQKTADGKIICSDLPCLAGYFYLCTPAEIIMNSEGQSVTVTVYGLENEKCHYTMVFGNVTAANCYFQKEDLNEKVFNQMFGNKEGQDSVIAEACGTA